VEKQDLKRLVELMLDMSSDAQTTERTALCMQAAMMAEVAMQLARQNELLEQQNSTLDAIRTVLNDMYLS